MALRRKCPHDVAQLLRIELLDALLGFRVADGGVQPRQLDAARSAPVLARDEALRAAVHGLGALVVERRELVAELRGLLEVLDARPRRRVLILLQLAGAREQARPQKARRAGV